MLFYKQYYFVGDNIRDSVVNMVAAVLGMIPEGLVLLTSVALTLGALKLAQKKTLVQELYCIETLARVDTLCLDKTGTITEGTMCVEAVESYPPVYDEISGEAAGNKTESGQVPGFPCRKSGAKCCYSSVPLLPHQKVSLPDGFAADIFHQRQIRFFIISDIFNSDLSGINKVLCLLIDIFLQS